MPRSATKLDEIHEKDCACCAEWFRCHRQELQVVFPGYCQREWRRELVFWLVKAPGNDRFQPAWNALMSITHIMDIIRISDIITILRIVVCFQRRYECAFEGLGSSVGYSRCWEQKQNPGIPDSIWRHNKGAIIDTRRLDHDHIQAMTAVKGFGWIRSWKWIAVNPLDTIVFCMTQHQTAIKSKMTLASG